MKKTERRQVKVIMDLANLIFAMIAALATAIATWIAWGKGPGPQVPPHVGPTSNVGLTAPRFIYSVMNHKCLDVPWDGGTDLVHMWEFHGAVNQRWYISELTGGSYKIISQHTGKCLEIEDQLPSDGARLRQGNFNERPHQLWRISRISPGIYSILNQHSGKAVDLLGWEDEDGALIGQWSWDGESKQRWRIEPPID
jgi:hypothetical protein